LVNFVTEVNAVEYNGRWYRTLDGTSPLSFTEICQTSYLALPSGWALAADNSDSLYVISSYRWGRHVIVVGSRSLWTQNGVSPGSNCNCITIQVSGSTYKVSGCNALILISKSFSPCTTCPAGESKISGRECGIRICVWGGWEAARKCILVAERTCRMTAYIYIYTDRKIDSYILQIER
jgi:hypothetical protein